VNLIWPIIRDTVVYYWEELFYLTFFNVIIAVAIIPGLVFLNPGTDIPLVLSVPTSIVLWSAVPYTLFGLFYTVYEISEGKAIKLSTFFSGGKKLLKQAYLWWVINIVVVILMLTNITFYNNLKTTWGGYLTLFFAGLFFAWLLVQLFALTLYPRLETPGFKLATRNALAILALKPIPVLVTAVLALVLAVVGIVIIPVGLFIAIALIATLINMTTRHILKERFGQEAEADG
jgi:hypothetical protein